MPRFRVTMIEVTLFAIALALAAWALTPPEPKPLTCHGQTTSSDWKECVR